MDIYSYVVLHQDPSASKTRDDGDWIIILEPKIFDSKARAL